MIELRCDAPGCISRAETAIDSLGRLLTPAGWYIVPGNPGCVACSRSCVPLVRSANNDK